jgi:hypothetical protein
MIAHTQTKPLLLQDSAFIACSCWLVARQSRARDFECGMQKGAMRLFAYHIQNPA